MASQVKITLQQIRIVLVVQMVVQVEEAVADTKVVTVEFTEHHGVTHQRHLFKALVGIQDRMGQLIL
jgi:hypothetical protein